MVISPITNEAFNRGWSILKSAPINPEWQGWYDFLFTLQESGSINMYGAPSVLRQMGVDRREASAIFASWTENYAELEAERRNRGGESPHDGEEYEDECADCGQHDILNETGRCLHCRGE